MNRFTMEAAAGRLVWGGTFLYIAWTRSPIRQPLPKPAQVSYPSHRLGFVAAILPWIRPWRYSAADRADDCGGLPGGGRPVRHLALPSLGLGQADVSCGASRCSPGYDGRLGTWA